MKKVVTILCLLATTIVMQAQFVGINTANPTATLDINGDVVLRTAELEVTDTVITALDVNTQKYSSYRVTDADSSFCIAGITAGIDGRQLTLINENLFPMELLHEDTLALEADRIITGDHENLILEHMGMVTLQYDSAAMRWIVNSSNQTSGGESVWDTVGDNAIFEEGFIGIGTDEVVSPLTMYTDSNGVGMTQVGGGEDSIVMTTQVHDDGTASIGTTTDHIFSINAGGEGVLHIRPDGSIVQGSNPNPQGLTQWNPEGGAQLRVPLPISAKHVIESGFNTSGLLHFGVSANLLDTIIVDEAIGGVSASFGTLSNHTFRLKTNSLTRFNILPDGRLTIGDQFVQPFGQLTIFQTVASDPNNNGLTVFTPNNTNGIVQIGGDGQRLAMRIGGSSGSIGTWTPHTMRIISNGLTRLNIDINGNVAIGIQETLPDYKLAVYGKIKATELVIETTGWPDYVFGNDYPLLSLDEVEKYIAIHKHLPNIPSASELEKGGLVVGDMQKRMMEKIEELTLYIIELKNEVESLKSTNR